MSGVGSERATQLYDRHGQRLGEWCYELGRGTVEGLDVVQARECRDFGGEEGTNGEGYEFACSVCGWRGNITDPRFCPYCGARVVR